VKTEIAEVEGRWTLRVVPRVARQEGYDPGDTSRTRILRGSYLPDRDSSRRRAKPGAPRAAL